MDPREIEALLLAVRDGQLTPQVANIGNDFGAGYLASLMLKRLRLP